MTITLASHHGMCFGVRDALRKTHDLAGRRPVTVLGQLVHNPVVAAHLRTLGVRDGRLDEPGHATTTDVVITAHGASDRHRAAWSGAGFRVTDTTCPLVRKAHTALARLVAEGRTPVVIGKKGHVEVIGLTGDFPGAVVVETEADLEDVPPSDRIGIVSQTTQPADRVQTLVQCLRALRPEADIRFIDTVCQPTRDRQEALLDLCALSDVVIVIGGRHSNNTRELLTTARRCGTAAHQVEGPADLDTSWFHHGDRVGVTAGTSTLDETVQSVMDRLRLIAAELRPRRAFGADLLNRV